MTNFIFQSAPATTWPVSVISLKLTSPHSLLLTPFPILANSGFKDAEVRHAVPRLGDVKRNYSDTSKAQRLLGWRAEVELAEGLARTVEWFTNL